MLRLEAEEETGRGQPEAMGPIPMERLQMERVRHPTAIKIRMKSKSMSEMLGIFFEKQMVTCETRQPIVNCLKMLPIIQEMILVRINGEIVGMHPWIRMETKSGCRVAVAELSMAE
ncbi:hypothetical protein ASC78_12720 [Variovorax sp. Root318D1]|nr:hypothetical protein ASC78_12720 [Variovorax sp. Root318D1]